jgi:hypothetical protein
MRVMYDRVAAIDVHKDMAAPRGALLYSRFSREEFGGYSWVRWLTWSRKAKGTIACQESSGRAHALGRGAAGPARYG